MKVALGNRRPLDLHKNAILPIGDTIVRASPLADVFLMRSLEACAPLPYFREFVDALRPSQLIVRRYLRPLHQSLWQVAQQLVQQVAKERALGIVPTRPPPPTPPPPPPPTIVETFLPVSKRPLSSLEDRIEFSLNDELQQLAAAEKKIAAEQQQEGSRTTTPPPTTSIPKTTMHATTTAPPTPAPTRYITDPQFYARNLSRFYTPWSAFDSTKMSALGPYASLVAVHYREYDCSKRSGVAAMQIVRALRRVSHILDLPSVDVMEAAQPGRSRLPSAGVQLGRTGLNTEDEQGHDGPPAIRHSNETEEQQQSQQSHSAPGDEDADLPSNSTLTDAGGEAAASGNNRTRPTSAPPVPTQPKRPLLGVILYVSTLLNISYLIQPSMPRHVRVVTKRDFYPDLHQELTPFEVLSQIDFEMCCMADRVISLTDKFGVKRYQSTFSKFLVEYRILRRLPGPMFLGACGTKEKEILRGRRPLAPQPQNLPATRVTTRRKERRSIG